MKRAHFRLIFILTVVLLMLVLVPVASAARPCIVAGAGTGSWYEELSDKIIDETYSFRLHYNSVADGKLWVSVVDSNDPDRIGYFTASLNHCDVLGDGFAMLSGLVVDSDISLMGPGATVRLIYQQGTVLIWSQRTFGWVIDSGKITVQN